MEQGDVWKYIQGATRSATRTGESPTKSNCRGTLGDHPEPRNTHQQSDGSQKETGGNLLETKIKGPLAKGRGTE